MYTYFLENVYMRSILCSWKRTLTETETEKGMKMDNNLSATLKTEKPICITRMDDNQIRIEFVSGFFMFPTDALFAEFMADCGHLVGKKIVKQWNKMKGCK